MSDASSRPVRSHARLRFTLAALCGLVFLAFLVALARVSATNPLHALHEVGATAFIVVLNFAVCLGSVVGFGLWRRKKQISH